MKIRDNYDLELLNILTTNGFSLEESSYVLNDLVKNVPLGEAIARVYYQRTIEKETYEPLPTDVFNDPVAF